MVKFKQTVYYSDPDQVHLNVTKYCEGCKKAKAEIWEIDGHFFCDKSLTMYEALQIRRFADANRQRIG
jgi:hypothetical protein